jgi:hypothetical protein
MPMLPLLDNFGYLDLLTENYNAGRTSKFGKCRKPRTQPYEQRQSRGREERGPERQQDLEPFQRLSRIRQKDRLLQEIRWVSTKMTYLVSKARTRPMSQVTGERYDYFYSENTRLKVRSARTTLNLK